MNFLIERFGLEGRILLNKVIFTGEFQGAWRCRLTEKKVLLYQQKHLLK